MIREDDIGLQIRMLSNLIRRDVERSKGSLEIDSPHGVHGWAIAYFYENRGKDIFQKDFENKFSIRRSTASNILKLMEKNGFITRESVDSDARLKKIVLTDKAVRVHNLISDNIKRREERLRRGVSEEELATFFAVMQKFKENMEDNDD